MKPMRVSLTLAAADDDGVCQTQNPASNADLTINGALATGGVATFDVARRAIIVSAADDSLVTFTIYGTNRNGISISEAMAGAAIGTATSTKNFKTITRIATAGNAGSLTVGTSGQADTPWLPLCSWANPATVALGVRLSTGAVLTYTVQHTFDDVQDLQNIVDGGTGLGIFSLNHEELASKTASDDGNYAFIPTATRLHFDAFTSGTAYFTVIQSGT